MAMPADCPCFDPPSRISEVTIGDVSGTIPDDLRTFWRLQSRSVEKIPFFLENVRAPTESSLEITTRSQFWADSQIKGTFSGEWADIFCAAPSLPAIGTAVRIT